MGLFLLVYTVFLLILSLVFIAGFKYGKKKDVMKPTFAPQSSGLFFGLLFVVPVGFLLVGLVKLLAYFGIGIW